MTATDTITVPTAPTSQAEADLDAQVGAFAEQLFGLGLGAFEAVTVTLGRRLGLYQALEWLARSAPRLLALLGAGIVVAAIAVLVLR